LAVKLLSNIGGGTTITFDINPNSDSPWHSQSALAQGAYKVEAAPDADFSEPKDIMYVNLKANQASSTGGTAPTNTPPQTRPRSGRGTSGRGNYVTPRTNTRTATRRTPAPVENTSRKGYVWFVFPTVMFNELNTQQHCTGTIKYMDWTTWYDTWDPNALPAEQTKDLFQNIVTPEDIKIKFDVNSEVTLGVEIQLNSVPNATATIYKGPNDSLTSEPFSTHQDAECILKITQTGIPYVLQYELKDDFAAALQQGLDPYKTPRKYNVTIGTNEGMTRAGLQQDTTTISNSILLDLGNASNFGSSTIKMNIVPTPDGQNYGLEELIKYLDYIETSFAESFAKRKWVIELIDKATLKPEDPYEWEGVDTNGDGTPDQAPPPGVLLDFDPFDDVYNQIERMIIYLE